MFIFIFLSLSYSLSPKSFVSHCSSLFFPPPSLCQTNPSLSIPNELCELQSALLHHRTDTFYQLLLHLNPHTHPKSPDGNSVLHEAFDFKSIEIIKILLQTYSNIVELKNDNDDTIVHQALESHHLDSIHCLLQNDSSCHIQQNIQFYIRFAVSLLELNFRTSALPSLISIITLLSQETPEKDTFLHSVVKYGSLPLLTHLFETSDYSFNPYIDNQLKQTPFHYAIELKSIRKFKLLFEKGLFNLFPAGYSDENSSKRLSLYFSLLSHSISTQHNQTTHFLYEYACDLFLNTLPTHTLLYEACRLGFLGIVYFLSKKPSTSFINHDKRTDDSPLHIAVRSGRLLALKILIDQSSFSPIDSINLKGNTPLHLAIQLDRLDMVELLFSSNASLLLTNNEQENPLFMACSLASSDTFFYLYNKLQESSHSKLFYHHKNLIGRTLLHLAVQHKHPSIISCLIQKHNLNPYECDHFEISPFHLAIRKDDFESVDLLLSLSQSFQKDCDTIFKLLSCAIKFHSSKSFSSIFSKNKNIEEYKLCQLLYFATQHNCMTILYCFLNAHSSRLVISPYLIPFFSDHSSFELAVQSNQFEIVSFFLNHEPPSDSPPFLSAWRFVNTIEMAFLLFSYDPYLYRPDGYAHSVLSNLSLPQFSSLLPSLLKNPDSTFSVISQYSLHDIAFYFSYVTFPLLRKYYPRHTLSAHSSSILASILVNRIQSDSSSDESTFSLIELFFSQFPSSKTHLPLYNLVAQKFLTLFPLNKEKRQLLSPSSFLYTSIHNWTPLIESTQSCDDIDDLISVFPSQKSQFASFLLRADNPVFLSFLPSYSQLDFPHIYSQKKYRILNRLMTQLFDDIPWSLILRNCFNNTHSQTKEPIEQIDFISLFFIPFCFQSRHLDLIKKCLDFIPFLNSEFYYLFFSNSLPFIIDFLTPAHISFIIDDYILNNRECDPFIEISLLEKSRKMNLLIENSLFIFTEDDTFCRLKLTSSLSFNYIIHEMALLFNSMDPSSFYFFSENNKDPISTLQTYTASLTDNEIQQELNRLSLSDLSTQHYRDFLYPLSFFIYLRQFYISPEFAYSIPFYMQPENKEWEQPQYHHSPGWSILGCLLLYHPDLHSSSLRFFKHIWIRGPSDPLFKTLDLHALALFHFLQKKTFLDQFVYFIQKYEDNTLIETDFIHFILSICQQDHSSPPPPFKAGTLILLFAQHHYLSRSLDLDILKSWIHSIHNRKVFLSHCLKEQQEPWYQSIENLLLSFEKMLCFSQQTNKHSYYFSIISSSLDRLMKCFAQTQKFAIDLDTLLSEEPSQFEQLSEAFKSSCFKCRMSLVDHIGQQLSLKTTSQENEVHSLIFSFQVASKEGWNIRNFYHSLVGFNDSFNQTTNREFILHQFYTQYCLCDVFLHYFLPECVLALSSQKRSSPSYEGFQSEEREGKLPYITSLLPYEQLQFWTDSFETVELLSVLQILEDHHFIKRHSDSLSLLEDKGFIHRKRLSAFKGLRQHFSFA